MSNIDEVVMKLYGKKMRAVFSHLVIELKHQSQDQLCRKTVRPNYATKIRFTKTNLPTAIALA